VSKNPPVIHGQCAHGINLEEFCFSCNEDDLDEQWEREEVRDEDVETIEILLEHAPLTGHEREQLESVIEEDEFKRVDRERFQQIVNQHIHILHANQ
jgi:hypothetical protein